MVKITLQYIPIRTDVAFLRIKQSYIHLLYYRVAFFIHVFTAIFSLFAGFTQFSKTLLKRSPKTHRILGYLYVISILFLSAPSGFIIGIHANGGISSQLAFTILAVLWFSFTLAALVFAKKKRFITHKKWMLRSYALTLSAITLRAWKYILVALFHPKPMDVYMIVAWLGWVLNLILVEIYIYNKFKLKPSSI